MCQAVRCTTCGKAGWRGCGAHVEQVLQGVPPAERCACAGGAKAPSVLDALRAMLAPKK